MLDNQKHSRVKKQQPNSQVIEELTDLETLNVVGGGIILNDIYGVPQPPSAGAARSFEIAF